MKKELGKKNCLYPMPATLVGANVKGKANFITIAHVGVAGMQLVSICLSKSHYTNQGIKENKTFSVNIPSINFVKETDYCGLVSGEDVDKSSLFEVFYGTLKTAPMITACPVNMECKLQKIVDFPTHELFIGEVFMTHSDEKVLTNGALDYTKLHPLFFTMQDKGYWTLGKRIAAAWSIGKKFKQ